MTNCKPMTDATRSELRTAGKTGQTTVQVPRPAHRGAHHLAVEDRYGESEDLGKMKLTDRNAKSGQNCWQKI